MGARDNWAQDRRERGIKSFSSPGPHEKLKGSKDKGGFLSRFSKGFTQFNKDINEAAHPVNLVKSITAFPRAVAGDLKADVLGRPSNAVDDYFKETFGGLKETAKHPLKNPGNTAMLLASLAAGGKSLGKPGALSKAPMLNKEIPAFGARTAPKTPGRMAELVGGAPVHNGGLRVGGGRTARPTFDPTPGPHDSHARDPWMERNYPDNGMTPADAYHSVDAQQPLRTDGPPAHVTEDTHPHLFDEFGRYMGDTDNPFDSGIGADPTRPVHGNPDGIGAGRYDLDRFVHGTKDGVGGRTHQLVQHLANLNGGYKNVEKTSRKFLNDDVSDIMDGPKKFNGTGAWEEYFQRGGGEPFDETFMKDGKNFMEGPVKKKKALKALRALMEQGPGLPTRPYNGRN